MPKGKALTEAEKAAKEAEKAKKFRELAQRRVNVAIKTIRLLEPLANKNAYTSTPEERAAVIKALEGAVVKVAQTFAGGAPTADFTFDTAKPETEAKPEAETK